MIKDLEKLGDGDVVDVSVCIVGAGAAGISLARRLTENGITFCLAEAGGLTFETASQDLYGGDSTGHPIDPREGRYRVFGGSTTQWGGRCAELDAHDFERRPWVAHSGWPIRKADLVPYYEAAKQALNFRQPWVADAALIGKRPPLKAFADGSGDVSLFIWRVASPDRRKTIRRHFKLGYHRNFDLAKAYRDELSCNPSSFLYLHANFASFTGDPSEGRIRRAHFRSLNGHGLTVTARHFVLAASGIENARILLNMEAAFLARINRYDTVGRYFMQHPRGSILRLAATAKQAALLQKTLNNFLRPPRYDIRYEYGFSLSEKAQFAHGLLNASAALQYSAGADSPWAAGRRLRDSLRRGALLSPSNQRDARMLLAGAGSILGNVLRKYVTGFELRLANPRIDVVIDLEQEPDRDSRIALADERDATGLRRVTIDWKIGPAERRTARFLAEALARTFAAAGLTKATMPDWLSVNRPLTDRDLAGNYHFIGATRMAASPEHGVVDRDCRVFGSANLHVVGASVFPTGGHANPTLTIVALALRLADYLSAAVSAEARPSAGAAVPPDHAAEPVATIAG